MKNALFLLLFAAGLTAQTPVDSLAIRQIDSLIQVSSALAGKRDFDKALEINAFAEKLALEKFGRESAAYGSACSNHGRVLHVKKNYPEAEKWYLQAQGIREKTLGRAHPDYAKSLYFLGYLYSDRSEITDFAKAESFYAEAKNIQEKALGKEHADYAQTVNLMGVLFEDKADFEQAEVFYLEYKAIQEKTLGREHPEYARSLNSLARVYGLWGQNEKAETLLLESKAIREKTLGKENADYPRVLHNLGCTYLRMGEYEKAESCFLEAIPIRERVLGKEHREYASSLYMLGCVYSDLGDFEKAEPLLLEAKATREKLFGREHPTYAQSLNSLGVLYKELRNYENAERLYLEVKEIQEKTIGKGHPDYAMALNNLALLYFETGNYAKAEPLYLESKETIESVLGSENPLFALCVDNLAGLYYEMGDLQKAEAYSLKGKEIREKTLGKEHIEYATSVFNLSLIYMKMGKNDLAEQLETEALALREKAVGNQHPEYLTSLNSLAMFYADLGRHEQATAYFSKASALEKTLLVRALNHLSERELNGYLRQFSENQSYVLSLTQKSGGQNPQTRQTAFDNALFYKGFLLNAANQTKRLALSATHGEATAAKFDLLKTCNRRLAAEYAKPIAERKNATQLEATANDLEKELARTVAGYGESRRQVKWQEVQQKLKPGEAAIEFVHYKFWDKTATDSLMYAALVLLPGTENPKFVPLFEEKQLDGLLLRKGLRNELYVKQLYSLADRGVIVREKAQKTLFELLWQPLEAVLAPPSGGGGGGVKTIYFSPSGLLHRLNLSAIPVSEDSTLADRYKLVELGSTRQLVVPAFANIQNNDALLMGGINYEPDSTAISAAAPKPDSSTVASRGSLPEWAKTDSNLRSGDWNFLPGSEKEIAELEKIISANGLQAKTFRGSAATEEAFKNSGRSFRDDKNGSPRILHLATHGYFFPDPKLEIGNSKFEIQEPVFKISELPMIRSGLILAGGNHAWKTGLPEKPSMEDGILTAYEIAQMDLSNTELVVLSACETGLGDIQGNEGVYGLQRAFKIAGAKYLIMSLWQVPDKQTARLMTLFYQKWLSEKMPIPEAFRAAQNELRERGFDPFYWAGFVLVE